MGRSFALHTFSGNLGFSSAPPVIAVLTLAMGWRASLILVGLLGVPVVVSIMLQSSILADQARHQATHHSPKLSGRELLTSRTMLLFFVFFLLGSMAGAGVQSWLVAVLHAVKSMDLRTASTALTGYMIGSTCGVLVGGWFADTYKRHVPAFAVPLTIASAVLVLTVYWASLPDVAVIAVMFAFGLALGASRTPRDVTMRVPSCSGRLGDLERKPNVEGIRHSVAALENEGGWTG